MPEPRMRLLWHRLNESSEARLNRIRRLGYFRFCALYAVIFPLGHLVAETVRATSTGDTAGFAALPIALAGWSATGAAVASVFWLAGRRRAKLRLVDSRRATPPLVER